MKHVIDLMTRGVDYARFSRVYFSEPFNQELVVAVDLVERRVRERSLLPDGRERICLYIMPRVHMPAWVAKLASGYTIGYDEDTIFDPARRCAHTQVHTPGRDLVRVSAETTFTEQPEGVHTRIELELKARLPGVGGMIERYMARETDGRYRIVERTLQQYVDQNRDR